MDNTEKRKFSNGSVVNAGSGLDCNLGFSIKRHSESLVDTSTSPESAASLQDEIWITTEQVDRDGDIIYSEGISFDNYFKNPIVGYNHGRGDDALSIPIGRTTSLDRVSGVGVSATFVWPPWSWDDPKSGVERVDDIHKLWRGFFINAASIWVLVKKAEPRPGHEEDIWPPLDIWESDMVEWSLVTIPANSGSTRRALKLLGESNYYRRAMQRTKKRHSRDSHAEVRNVLVGINSISDQMDKLNIALDNFNGGLR